MLSLSPYSSACLSARSWVVIFFMPSVFPAVFTKRGKIEKDGEMLIFSTSITSKSWQFSFVALRHSFQNLGVDPPIAVGPQVKTFSLVSGSLQELCTDIPGNIRVRQCVFWREGRKEKKDLLPYYYLKHLEKPLQVIKKTPHPTPYGVRNVQAQVHHSDSEEQCISGLLWLAAWISALIFHFPNLLLEQVGTSILWIKWVERKDLFSWLQC